MKMLKAVLILLFTFSTLVLQAQNETLQTASSNTKKHKRSFIALSMNFPSPTGDYKSTDFKSENALFAKGSFGLALEGAFMFHPNIGVGGIWGGYGSKFDAEKYNEGVVKALGLKGSTSINTSAGSHSVGIFMAGPNLSLPLKGISLDFKFYVGSLAYRFPEIKTTVINGGNTIFVKFNSENVGSAFGFNPGVAARIKLSRRLLFKVSVDYLEGKPKVKTTSSGTVNGAPIPTESIDNSFTISMVNVGLGLGIQLNKE